MLPSATMKARVPYKRGKPPRSTRLLRQSSVENDKGPTSSEEALADLKFLLVRTLKQIRRKQGLSQIALAHRMGSSQSRVAKVEAGDPSVSLDLIARAFVAIGASSRDVMQAFLSRSKIR